MQELRGNIRVYVRVKPGEAGIPSVLHCEDGHRITCSAAGAIKARSSRSPTCCPAHEGLARPTGLSSMHGCMHAWEADVQAPTC